MSIGEFELINRYFLRHQTGNGVVLGVGDDCALLQPPAGRQLAVSMDTLVADVHFPADADPELIAERALRVNLSDLAAMGAEPLWFTLGLTLTEADSDWLEAFSRGLFACAEHYGCRLVGGDTTRGPLSITIQVQGAVEPGAALLRSAAEAGDRIFVTGTLGDGAAALAVIQGRAAVGESNAGYFRDCFYRPRPRLAEAAYLRGLAHSALDVSDGLLADLGHICRQSGLGARLQLEQLPLSDPLRELCADDTDQTRALAWALAGGDDYQLCFTLPEAALDELQTLIVAGKLEATEIGVMTAEAGIDCRLHGAPYLPEQAGYRHF